MVSIVLAFFWKFKGGGNKVLRRGAKVALGGSATPSPLPPGSRKLGYSCLLTSEFRDFDEHTNINHYNLSKFSSGVGLLLYIIIPGDILLRIFFPREAGLLTTSKKFSGVSRGGRALGNHWRNRLTWVRSCDVNSRNYVIHILAGTPSLLNWHQHDGIRFWYCGNNPINHKIFHFDEPRNLRKQLITRTRAPWASNLGVWRSMDNCKL